MNTNKGLIFISITKGLGVKERRAISHLNTGIWKMPNWCNKFDLIAKRLYWNAIFKVILPRSNESKTKSRATIKQHTKEGFSE